MKELVDAVVTRYLDCAEFWFAAVKEYHLDGYPHLHLLLSKRTKFDFFIGTKVFDYDVFHPNVSQRTKQNIFDVC
jgi:hypothetical protein